MTPKKPKVEVGSPNRIERPPSEKTLELIQAVLEGFQFAEGAEDLTAEDISETWDLPTNWPDERVVGKRWELSDQNSMLRVLNYEKEARKKLGELFAEKRATVAHFHLHGQLDFSRLIGGGAFNGIMYFLGDGDHIEEIQVFSEYARGETPDVEHALYDFSNAIGLGRLVRDAQDQSHQDLPRVEHRVTVMGPMAKDIAGAFDNLRAVASGGT